VNKSQRVKCNELKIALEIHISAEFTHCVFTIFLNITKIQKLKVVKYIMQM
jgi:hypothetical protein